MLFNNLDFFKRGLAFSQKASGKPAAANILTRYSQWQELLYGFRSK